MDNYYKERDVLRYPNIDLFRQEPKFYLPTHLCLQQLCDDLTSLTQGQSIYQKTFVFEINFYKKNEQGECILEKINPSDIIIIEGIFAQHFANDYLPMEYLVISVNVANSSYLNIIKVMKKVAENRLSEPLNSFWSESRYIGKGRSDQVRELYQDCARKLVLENVDDLETFKEKFKSEPTWNNLP